MVDPAPRRPGGVSPWRGGPPRRRGGSLRAVTAARIVEGAGVPLAVTVRGDGPVHVLVHGLASDAAAWAPAAGELAGGGRRVVTYDRRGYGASGAPEPYGATTVQEQAEDLVAVLDAVGADDAVLLGDGFGALVALDAMRRHARRVRAAALADPPLFAFAPAAAEALSEERRALEEAVREGGPELAVERWLGPGADPAAVRRARAAHRAFFADFAGLATWPVTRGELRALRGPAAIAVRDGAPAHVEQAAAALAALLPGARRVAGAGLVAAALALSS
jgi:pimeloyl-ACP methyl ester carboxylesterase